MPVPRAHPDDDQHHTQPHTHGIHHQHKKFAAPGLLITNICRRDGLAISRL